MGFASTLVRIWYGFEADLERRRRETDLSDLSEGWRSKGMICENQIHPFPFTAPKGQKLIA